MGASEPEQVIDIFCKLFNSKDLAGLIDNLYEDDAILIPEPGAAPVAGKAALTEVLKAFVETGGTISVISTKAVRSGDLALTHTHWRLDIPGADAMEAQTAEVVRRQPDGTWKYAIDNPWGTAVLTAGG
jgi:ketosteroid isomerase-like protein